MIVMEVALGKRFLLTDFSELCISDVFLLFGSLMLLFPLFNWMSGNSKSKHNDVFTRMTAAILTEMSGWGTRFCKLVHFHVGKFAVPVTILINFEVAFKIFMVVAREWLILYLPLQLFKSPYNRLSDANYGIKHVCFRIVDLLAARWD